MALDPVPRNGTVSDAVFTRLVDEILSGRWPADGTAPSERDLAVELKVNRHSVREALKRLQQAGLLEISHGGKTKVLDWRRNAGLDMISSLINAKVISDVAVFGDAAVMRRIIGADAARLCASRGDDGQLAAVRAAADAYPEMGDLSVMRDADLEFWTAVIDGSGNLTYRLALNTLVRSIDDVSRDAFNEASTEMFLDRAGHLALADAILARDAEKSRELAYKQLSQLVDLLQADG